MRTSPQATVFPEVATRAAPISKTLVLRYKDGGSTRVVCGRETSIVSKSGRFESRAWEKEFTQIGKQKGTFGASPTGEYCV